MKQTKLFLSVVFITTMFYSCGEPEHSTSIVEVKIGNQIWMGSNLNVDKFRNGDIIPEAKTDKEWEDAGDNGKPAYCYLDNDRSNGAKYGKLYNRHAMQDFRGLAPEGWKVPSESEWMQLVESLGGDRKEAALKIKSTHGWVTEPHDKNGTNETGFSAFPCGVRENSGTFSGSGEFCTFWASSLDDDGASRAFCLNPLGNIWMVTNSYSVGFSLRCLASNNYKPVNSQQTTSSDKFQSDYDCSFDNDVDVFNYLIGKTFKEKNGGIEIQFNTSGATISGLRYTWDFYKTLGGYKGFVKLNSANLSNPNGTIKLYISCREKSITDGSKVLLLN